MNFDHFSQKIDFWPKIEFWFKKLNFACAFYRSRFGKTLLPKNGLISNVVDAVESGVIPDVWLVPVSFSYDNVIEGMFYDELLGIRKEKESVMGVIKGIYKSFGEQGRCGTVMMNFGTPVRLTVWLNFTIIYVQISRPINVH